MGKPTTDGIDRGTTIVAGSFAAAGAGDWVRVIGDFAVSLAGTFEGSFQLETSYDGGETAIPVTAAGVAVNFSGPCREIVSEPEDGILYRWNCLSLASGEADWRIAK